MELCNEEPLTVRKLDFEPRETKTHFFKYCKVVDDDVYLHLHVTASRRDYTCVGGHLLTALVNGACEIFVEDYGLDGVGRKFDPETGLNLYEF